MTLIGSAGRTDPGDSSPRAPGLGIAVQAVCTFPLLLLGTLATQLRAEMHFGQAAVGLLASIVVVASVVASAPAGRLCDSQRGGRALALCAAGAALSLGGAASFAHSWMSLVPWLVVGGFAIALAQPASDVWLTQTVAVDRRVTAFGIKQAVVGPGIGLLAGFAVPLAQATVGWRGVFIGGFVVALLLLGVLLRRGEAHVPSSIMRTELRPLPAVALGLRSAKPSLLLLGVVGAFGNAPFMAYLAHSVSSAVDRGLSASEAGVLYGVAAAAALITRILLGRVIAGREPEALSIVAAFLLAGAVGFLFLASGSQTTTVIGMPIVAATAGGWHGLFFWEIGRLHADAPGRASGLVGTGIFLGGVLGPLVVGLCSERSFGMAWTVASALSVVAACFAHPAITLRGSR